MHANVTRLPLAILALACVAPDPCPGAAPPPAPAAHWRLDETSGTRVADSAGTAHGINRGAQQGRPGRAGSAYAFDGLKDHRIDLGATFQIDSSDKLTICATVRASRFSPPDRSNIANSRNGILGSDDARLIFALCDRGRLVFVWHAGPDGYQQIVTETPDSIPTGHWVHLAAVRDGPRLALYVNGVAKAKGPCSTANFQRLGNLCIGRVNASAARDFCGDIDDVRVYRAALAPADIRALAVEVDLDGITPPTPPWARCDLKRITFQNPDLQVDLGVGLWAWPLPIDHDGDGDLDLVVSCHDAPYNGTYLFENPGGSAFPIFHPARRISRGITNVQISYPPAGPRVLAPGQEYPHFRTSGLEEPVTLPGDPTFPRPQKVRSNMWRLADFDGDDRLDLVVGIGDWTDYGWDNAFDERGRWTRGPLRGILFLLRNTGTTAAPQYAPATRIATGDGEPVEVFGMPSPNLGDFDGDGDLDLLCGEFVDSFTYFENVGTRSAPRLARGRKLLLDGAPLTMHLCMITPTAIDWDRDGDLDLVVGQEDGRVALIEHAGRTSVDHLPLFAAPKFFRQRADPLKCGALVTPVSFDWDADGDEDLVCGNTAGHILFIENLDGGDPPRWAEPRPIEIDGKPFRIMAGPNGSIQGPCEAKWGYTTLSVADWDLDGLPDVLLNSIWGKVLWSRNVGSRRAPQLSTPEPVAVAWDGPPPKPAWTWWQPAPGELATQWRTTPFAIDWTGDGLIDLVMLDPQGFLSLYPRARRDGRLILLPPRHAFADERGEPLRLNAGEAGRSGRRKFCMTDWDGDGRVDLLIDSANVDLYLNTGSRDGITTLAHRGALDGLRLAGHDTSPTTVDWDRDGTRDLLVGAEDGHFYFLKNDRQKRAP